MNINTVIDSKLFLEMWSAWEDVIPQKLSRENPRVLLRLLELAATPKGVFQVELKSALSVNQSALSKLVAKLRKAELVKVSTPAADRRKAQVKTSETGKALLANLNKKLGEVGTASSTSAVPRKARKGIRDAVGQATFF